MRLPGADALRVEFDCRCSTERRHDPLTITDGTGRIVATRSGRERAEWSSELRIPGMQQMNVLVLSLSHLLSNQVMNCVGLSLVTVL